MEDEKERIVIRYLEGRWKVMIGIGRLLDLEALRRP